MNPLHYLVSLYAPHECVRCGLEGRVLCEACHSYLSAPPVSQCYRCGSLSSLGRTCAACYRQTGLLSVNCATRYEGVAKSLVWNLKFERSREAANILGRYMAELYGELLTNDVLVVPVPTATRRVRRRGYDQAVLIARSFAKHTGLEYSPLLRRLGSQEQKGASRQQRHEQLREAFEVRRFDKLVGRRIILIDDVITTGATLEAAAKVLRRHGALRVGALAFARA